MSQQKNHGGCFKEEYGERIEVEVYRGLYDGRLHEHREAELLEWISHGGIRTVKTPLISLFIEQESEF